MKTCTKCHKTKEDNEFYLHRGCCKDCQKAYTVNYHKLRYHSDESYRIACQTFRKKYRNSVHGKYKEQSANRRNKKKYLQDPIYCLKNNLGRRIRMGLKNNMKSGKTQTLIGCSWKALKVHLESQFKEGMTWNNYGKWHIDHIKPCALFNLSEPKEQVICFHYSNLQPLWAVDNLVKGARVIG